MVMSKLMMFGLACAALTCMSTSAFAKNHCKNNNTTYFDKDNDASYFAGAKPGTYECRHNSQFYVERCDAGFTVTAAGRCKRTAYVNHTEPKCSVGNWKCEVKGADKCYSKKNCEGALKGNIQCSGLNAKELLVDHQGKTDFCAKEDTTVKDKSVDKCPVGFKKSDKPASTGANGYVKYYCVTAL